MWTAFATAISFLTLFTVPFATKVALSPQELARSLAFYPLVGLILGALWSAFIWICTPTVPSLLLAAMATALLSILTRALHLDGLSDLCDGLGGGYTIERRLEIMKDSRTGAFGALALSLAVALKMSALDVLIGKSCWMPILVIPALSRYAMVLGAYKSIYARPEGGLGKPFLEAMTPKDLLTSTLMLLPCAVIAPLHVLTGLPLAFLVALIMRSLSTRCLGGITGDVLGAVNELSEITLLAAAACLAGH